MSQVSRPADFTFAIISGAPLAATLLDAVCSELAERTGCKFTPLLVRDYAQMREGIRTKQVHVAWAPPLIAIELEAEAEAKIRLCSRRAGSSHYRSVLFSRQDSKIQSLADLQGTRVAWVAKESSAGYIFPRLRLQAEGFALDKLFAEESFRRTHEAVARAVLTGQYDVGATYASFPVGSDVPSSAGWVEAAGSISDVRILLSTGPIPSDVIMISSELPEDQVALISAALTNLGQPIRSLMNAEAFEPPAPGHFDELRRMITQARLRHSP